MDPDILALLALGEDAGDAADRDHLAGCAECLLELDTLRHAAAAGRSTFETGEMLTPAPRVWSAIERELGRSATPLAPVVPLRRRAPLRLLVAAAAVVALVAGGATWWALTPTPPTVLASATLDPFPGWTGAEGSATVEERADGERVVEVTLSASGADSAYREVWLISSDATELVSLGVLRGTDGTFTIPDGLDLGYFDLVDISEEAFDGDPTHSGDSIVRGQLSAT